GTGKATLPGELQVYRFSDHDVVALASEPSPGGRALLEPIWRGRAPVRETSAVDDLTDARERVRNELDAMPDDLKRLEGAAPRKLVASGGLALAIERLVEKAGENLRS
ncbi:MAG TPA: hypothetical protein VIF62_07760, partial [Labilithrix sp.]